MASSTRGRKELPQRLVDAYMMAFEFWIRNPTASTLDLKAVALGNIYRWRERNDERCVKGSRRLRLRDPITDRRRPYQQQRNRN